MTYRQLEMRSNQLARYLRGLGVGPESVVGVCVERSVEMVVSLLGILKAGGAYLPLDPKYPVVRLDYMVEDSGAPVLLTQQRLVATLAGYAGRCIEWEQIAAVLSEQPCDVPYSAVSAQKLAYVIYTSGSTGRVKGVAAVHAGVVNRVQAQQQYMAYEAGESCCLKTSLSFVSTQADPARQVQLAIRFQF